MLHPSIVNSTFKWVQVEKKRYYEAHFQRDLLGDLIAMQSWGGIGTRRGSHKSHYCVDEAQAQHYLNKLLKRRQQRGYSLKEG